MSPLQKRQLMFLTGCLGTRLMFVYLARIASPSMLQILGALALLPATGFWYIYLTGSRKRGPETLGSPIWWNSLRPLHGTLYAIFAFMALFGYQNAWFILLLDVLIGATAFTYHHTMVPHMV
jgi:hypothetical protein